MKFILILIFVTGSGQVTTANFPAAFATQPACIEAGNLVGMGALPRPPMPGELQGFMCFPQEVENDETSDE